MKPSLFAAAGALLLAGCAAGAAPSPASPAAAAAPAPAEILWDRYGIPHIYASSAEGLFRAFGRSQMQAHGNLLLRMYGESRGRAAEYWGAANLDSDRWVHTVGIPRRADEWYAAQPADERRILDEFAAGINDYARAHPELIADSVEVVLPVTGRDVLAHIQRVIHFTFMTDRDIVERQAEAHERPGSNGWAVAPSRSATGNALLLANPHLPWNDVYTWFEAQHTAPGLNAYGAALVGTPMLAIAFNENLGWTHTVNLLDNDDLYALAPVGEQGYRWEGGVRPWTVRVDTLRVRQADGTVRTEPLRVRHSVHGPVVQERGGRAYALRVAGLDQPRMFGQYWRMARARDRVEFEAALSELQMPFFNVIYADRQGHILYVFNGRVPVRRHGGWSYWSGVLPGDSAAALWTSTHAYGDLPRVLDPATGWLQNANDAPWTSTIPQRLDPNSFPAYFSPRGMALRPQISARMMVENPRITLDDMIRLKHSTRLELADRVLDELIPAARASVGLLARQAADVLQRWDRAADADSRGAVLFTTWMLEMASRGHGQATMFATPWDPAAPLTTPDGLKNPGFAAMALDSAAALVQARYGALDVPWGQVHRLRRDSLDLPANGADGIFGVFRVTNYARSRENRLVARGGDSYVSAVEFSSPVRARALLVYGNSSQPGSPHRTDQLRLYSAKELRPVWFTRAEVEANLAERQEF